MQITHKPTMGNRIHHKKLRHTFHTHLSQHELWKWLLENQDKLQDLIPNNPDLPQNEYKTTLYLTPDLSKLPDQDIIPISSSTWKRALIMPGSTKQPKNRTQKTFVEMMQRKGWTISSRCWPSYFMVKGPKQDQIAIVAVKSARSRKLKTHQKALLQALAAYGVPCYRYDPDFGFQKICVNPEQEGKAA